MYHTGYRSEKQKKAKGECLANVAPARDNRGGTEQAPMSEVTFRFYGNLNDFLPAVHRGAALVHTFAPRVSVKDAIESLGVPHPEIDLLVANGTPVDFSYHVHPGDRIAVYPRFANLDVGSVSRVRPPRLDDLRFVLRHPSGRDSSATCASRASTACNGRDGAMHSLPISPAASTACS